MQRINLSSPITNSKKPFLYDPHSDNLMILALSKYNMHGFSLCTEANETISKAVSSGFLTLTLVGSKKLAVVNSECSGGAIGRFPEEAKNEARKIASMLSIEYQAPCQQSRSYEFPAQRHEWEYLMTRQLRA